jgi:very-short-patch-repair endonuclease
MTYAEKKLLGIQLTYSRVKPDFFWPRERVAIEYQGGYHGEGETFLRDCDKDNFYASRGITVLKITKQNWEGALRLVQGLLFKRRGWKTKNFTQKLPPLFSFV